MRACRTGLAALSAFCSFSLFAQSSPADAAKRGQAQFAQSCAFCHGPDATGGAEGPNLMRSAVVRHDDNGNLIGPVIRDGRPKKGMPAIRISEPQIADVVAYLHSRLKESDLTSPANPRQYSLKLLLTGNANTGKAFFYGEGQCSHCHSPTGDLAGIAKKYPPADLQARFLYPADVPKTATVTTNSGQQFKGELAYHDLFTIAIKDEGGWYHSWPANQVRFQVHDPVAAHLDLLHKYKRRRHPQSFRLPGDAEVKLLALFLLSFFSAVAQALDPAALLKPPRDTWPTYNGDYSGRRFSTLSQINQSNVASLAMAWAFQTHSDTLKSTPLEVNGVLYFTTPDNVWAVDARTGHRIWHYTRPSQGDHVGHRGVAMWKDRLYFGTPDAHLICLNARDGKPIWDIQIADVRFGYYVAIAPLVVKDELILGTSGDSADVPHFIEALDPITGKILWRWNTLPDPGAPGSETWPDKESLLHGGGPAWLTGTYDPDLNLIYWGTGNPHPVLAGVARAGSNLYTCSIVALNADTGKLAWYYQPSPHDTHDWDAVETPVLFDAEFGGKPRKLLAQASRNGYFFLLDRATGEHLLTAPFVPLDWASGLDSKGQPISNPAKEPQRRWLLSCGL